MKTIYTLVNSETDLVLGHVYLDEGGHQYCWERADRTNCGLLYPTAIAALEAMGAAGFAHMPVHVVNG